MQKYYLYMKHTNKNLVNSIKISIFEKNIEYKQYK